MLLLAISATAEDVHLQAAVPGEAGTIALRVTLDESHPAVLGLGVLGLIVVRMRQKRQ